MISRSVSEILLFFKMKIQCWMHRGSWVCIGISFWRYSYHKLVIFKWIDSFTIKQLIPVHPSLDHINIFTIYSPFYIKDAMIKPNIMNCIMESKPPIDVLNSYFLLYATGMLMLKISNFCKKLEIQCWSSHDSSVMFGY